MLGEMALIKSHFWRRKVRRESARMFEREGETMRRRKKNLGLASMASVHGGKKLLAGLYKWLEKLN